MESDDVDERIFKGYCCSTYCDYGCGSSDDADVASVRVLHAIADAPRVNVYLDNELVLGDVDFRAGSGYLPILAGTYDVRVEAIVPGGNLDVITVDNFDFAADTASTLIATGDVSDSDIVPLTISEPTEGIAAGNLRLRVSHASTIANAAASAGVYVAVSTEGVAFNQAPILIGPLPFRETTPTVEAPASAAYQVRIALDPDGTAVVFDSGVLDPLPEGANLHVVAVDSTVPSIGGSAFAPLAAASPVSLVVLDGTGAADIFDVNTGSFLTIVHDAPGIPAVDVFADITATPATEEVQLTDDLVYGNFEPRQTVPATEYAVGVRLASDNSSDAFGFPADLKAGMGYTAIARLVEDAPAAQVLIDDYRSVATESKVRIVHGSPAAGPADVYVFATDLANPATPASGDPLLENFVYGAETGFVSLAPGS